MAANVALAAYGVVDGVRVSLTVHDASPVAVVVAVQVSPPAPPTASTTVCPDSGTFVSVRVSVAASVTVSW